ncbi:MAG TPA: VTT domain-containing protein [Steroidobacteraceae bacterium]|nr:VTT domain-containing protein [Steroidobacteraceae bacterium]
MPLRSQHRAVWRRAALLLLLCAALALVTASKPLHAALLEVLASSKAVIIDYPALGALLFVLLAAVSAMLAFVSIAILVPVAVYAWGEPLSMLMLWLGWILGGIAAYVIARFLGRPVVKWLMAGHALRRLEQRIHPDTPLGLIVLLQLGLPSEIPGYLLGLVRYPFGRFLAALALGELPYTIATVWLGAGFVTARGGVVLAVGLAIAALSVGAFHLLRRRLRAYGDSS